METLEARELLERVGRIGPYFAVRHGAAGEGPPNGFRPLRELLAADRPDGPLAVRITTAARQLGTTEPRVAASVVHLGLTARFWSLALGTAALGGAVPDLDPERGHFALPPGGPLDLWLPAPALTAVGAPAALVEHLHRTVVLGVLEPLAAAVRASAPVAPRLLAGNCASALVGSLRVLAADPVLRHGGAPGTALALVRGLLDRPPLAGAGVLAPAGPLRFRRTNCCLYYRVPGGGLCGDCVFDRPPATVPDRA